MNYYPFHIGDFRSGTINMTRLSRWIYRDMLDVYYDTEKPLSLDFDVLCDQLGAESDEERRLVERLLKFKFTKCEDGYRHEICEQVIAEYRAKSETAKANGSKGGRKPKPKDTKAKPEETKPEPSGFQSGSDEDASGQADQTGSQTNQEPITNLNTPHTPQGGEPGGMDDVGGEDDEDGDGGDDQATVKQSAIELKTYIANCKAAGVPPIPEGDAVFKYAEDAGIPDEFLRLQWLEFKDRYTTEKTKQKSWPKKFLNSVKGNWYKLWYMDGSGSYQLTTQGKQAQQVHKGVVNE